MVFKSWFSNLLLFDNEDKLLSYEGTFIELANTLEPPISLLLFTVIFEIVGAVTLVLLFPEPLILVVGSIFLTTAVTVL